MEWVETTAKSVDEAKDLALDQLGVAADDAEFEVLEEPKAGLFGRVRGEARVRARVRPTQARQKVERRDRRKPRADGSPAGVTPDPPPDPSSEPPSDGVSSEADASAPPARRGRGRGGSSAAAVAAPAAVPAASPAALRAASSTTEEQNVTAAQVGEEAQRFVEELVSRFGLRGDVSLVEDGDDLEVLVSGDDLGLLVGPRGATLQALQDLTRVASQRRLGDHDTRLRVDVGGYRSRRRVALSAFAVKVAGDVVQSGSPIALEAMNSADRKVVHDALNPVDGVSTRSEGDDPHRRVIVDPTPS